jgi:C2 domain
MRIPSYCDRILKRSLPGLSATVNTYTSVDTIMTSDHSPVTATVTAELAHTSGLRSLDDIEAPFKEPEIVDREVTLGLDSSCPQAVVAGALGIVKGGYNDLEDVTFVLEFTSLSACNLPEMDGAAQGAANMVAQTMVGSGGAARVSASAEGGTVTAGYGATDTTARGGEPGVAGSADKARGEGGYNGLGYCDPYCVFHGDGVAELAEGQYETAVLKGTQKPRWNVTSQVPKVALLDDVDSLLRCRYLTITVMDEDVGSADDVVGNVVLWLGDGWLTAPEEGGVVARAEFSVCIQYDGLRRGKLSGSYVIRRTKLAATAALCGAVSGL